MPRKKNSAARKIQRAYRNRRFRRGLNKGSRAVTINTRSTVAPDSILVKLPYADTRYTTTTGTFATFNHFRLNSIQDPNYSGAGHQPMGHDQWAAFYERYSVYGCKVELSFINATGNDPYHVVFYPSSIITTPASLADAKEVKHSETLTIMPGERPTKLTRYYDMATILGRKRSDLSQSRFQTTFGSNPSDDVYLHVYSQNVDGTSAIAAQMYCRLLFYCKFDSVIIQTGS